VNDLLAARAQMAISLGFHIFFAVVGSYAPAVRRASRRTEPSFATRNCLPGS